MKKIVLLLMLLPFFGMAQSKHSLSARKLYSQAVKAFENGSYEEALDLFGQCITEAPTYAEAYLNSSIILFYKKDYPQSLNYARSAWTYNKFQPEVFGQLGKCHFYNENYDSAAIYLNRAIELGGTIEYNYIYLGKCELMLEDYNSAADHFTAAISLNQSNPISYNDRGTAYFNMGEYEKAEADFNKALELNPGSAGIYANLANVALATEDAEKALGYINEGIAKASDDEKVQLLILKGNYYHGQGDYVSAAATYQEAYDMDNANAIVLTNQASVLIDLEDYEGALDKCNQALELQPEMMEAYFNRGIANEMLRNVEDACMDWEQAFILGSEKAEEFLNSPICTE